jgi:protein SCO1/2
MSSERSGNGGDGVFDFVELTADRTRGSQRLLTASACLVLMLFCFLAGYLLAPRLNLGTTPRSRPSAQRVELPRPLPVADFSLEDVGAPSGARAYTRDRLLGQWTLMYFGYSHCPDICRPTLGVIAQVARTLRAETEWTSELELVFVSVDPERDSAETLRTYLASAPVDITGLRGSEREVAALATQLGLLHGRREVDAAGDYLVDHPATILVIDPAAQLRAGFTLPHDPARISERVLRIAHTFADERSG